MEKIPSVALSLLLPLCYAVPDVPKNEQEALFRQQLYNLCMAMPAWYVWLLSSYLERQPY